LAAISAMEAFVMRFLWSAAAAVISFTFSSDKTLISAFSSGPGHGRPGQSSESS
jgi:hypothetical protein